ncbi:MAG: hypothetical protein ACREYE_32845, partial [Gammaproteobacteria bacterium]
PQSLSRNEQALATMYLKGLDHEMQQALLDELGEKIQFQAKTPHRVRNAIGFLCWMCNEAKVGRPPLTSAYLKHRERRDRERVLQAHIEAEQRRLTELALRQAALRMTRLHATIRIARPPLLVQPAPQALGDSSPPLLVQPAPQALDMENTFVDGVTESLCELTRRRTYANRISRNTALLSRHVLRVGCPPEGYAECTRRRGAKELGLSVSEFRTALDTLRLWGWIERRPRVPNTGGHYRLTRQFVEVVRRDDVALYHVIRNRLPMVFDAEQDSGEKANEAMGDSYLRQALQALTLAQLMHRIFELNRIQREHYRRAYNKGTLRNVCTMLYWLLQEVERDLGKVAPISLRSLCKQTGLVFHTAKRARDQLVAWGLLTQEGDVYHLNHQRLADILEGEDAGLPSPSVRAPLQAPWTFKTHRTVASEGDETTGACPISPEQKLHDDHAA